MSRQSNTLVGLFHSPLDSKCYLTALSMQFASIDIIIDLQYDSTRIDMYMYYYPTR